jgi:hypothetical protein
MRFLLHLALFAISYLLRTLENDQPKCVMRSTYLCFFPIYPIGEKKTRFLFLLPSLLSDGVLRRSHRQQRQSIQTDYAE